MAGIYMRTGGVSETPFIQVGSSGNYDGTIAWDIEVASAPLTYSMAYQGSGNLNWGDASNEDVSSATLVIKTHTYNTAGTYTMVITGNITRFIAGTNSTSQNLVRMIHSMSLSGYLGNNTSYSYGEFANCKYATMSDNFTFANSILYLIGTFYNCYALIISPSNFALPPTIEKIDYIFRNCTAYITMPNTFSLPNTLTSIIGAFYGADRIKFTSNLSIPTSITNISHLFRFCARPNLNKVVIHSGIDNFSYAFSETNTIEVPIWPVSFSASTINVNGMYYHYIAPTVIIYGGDAPANLFWLDTSKTWLNTGEAFYNAKHHSNYSSIPSSWK